MRSAGLTLSCLLLVTALTIGLGSYKVAQRHEMIRIGYRLTEANAELRELREENRRLRLEKSVLTHPERIERLARARGMVLPAPEQIRVVRPGQTVSNQQQDRRGLARAP